MSIFCQLSTHGEMVSKRIKRILSDIGFNFIWQWQKSCKSDFYILKQRALDQIESSATGEEEK